MYVNAGQLYTGLTPGRATNPFNNLAGTGAIYAHLTAAAADAADAAPSPRPAATPTGGSKLNAMLEYKLYSPSHLRTLPMIESQGFIEQIMEKPATITAGLRSPGPLSPHSPRAPPPWAAQTPLDTPATSGAVRRHTVDVFTCSGEPMSPVWPGGGGGGGGFEYGQGGFELCEDMGGSGCETPVECDMYASQVHDTHTHTHTHTHTCTHI